MAWFNRLGTRTCRTSPTNEATNEVMKIPLWAPMMGRTRRSQGRERSGSMVARGASLRATSAMGTYRVSVRRARWAAVGDKASSWRGAPGQTPGVRARRQRTRPAKAWSASASLPRLTGDLVEAGIDRTVGRLQRPMAELGDHVVDPAAVVLHRPPLDQPPGDQSVDHRGDGGRPHGQALGEVGGERRAPVQHAEHAVLGRDRSAAPSPISTCLDSQAAVRPRVRCSSAGPRGPRAALVLVALRLT